jgi:hypothetical protein
LNAFVALAAPVLQSRHQTRFCNPATKTIYYPPLGLRPSGHNQLRRASVSSLIQLNAECAFPLHLSDFAPCFSVLPVTAGSSILLRCFVRNALAPPGAGLLASRRRRDAGRAAVDRAGSFTS